MTPSLKQDPEDVTPNPEFLIKSIAEQGYSLETSIADLIDNSISAQALNIEILVDTQTAPFALFITDNGLGMTEAELQNNMKFPSSSMESQRANWDLGRFGLGLKTASFAQTRKFTVISKKEGDKRYAARTWDVNHLKNTGRWEVLVNTEKEIEDILKAYNALSNGFLNPFDGYIPNTIILWHGLYKFDSKYNSENKYTYLQKELNDNAKDYLQLIFHRFMEKPEPLTIRLNNDHLTAFNPFPQDARSLPGQQKLLLDSKLKIEGFVLPNRSINESKEVSHWTLANKSLMDMEGIYIYRADRIIAYGGWNGLIKKSARLQLARLKVEIDNGVDNLFHLNVAKSSITIPFTEQFAFVRYVSELKNEAEKEYFNYDRKAKSIKTSYNEIFKKTPTSHGLALEFDDEFPLLKSLVGTLSDTQIKQLRIILRMVTTTVNKIKKVHGEDSFVNLVEKDNIDEHHLIITINNLLENGYTKDYVYNNIIPMMGIKQDSMPESILKLLK